ncbi:MAG TPA: fused MFS/spermidine synthase [Candidatus Limnocylindrales bacterium]|nr:fused MFS/spermidine synthase [Candidatus Limnocylindrales bacterium]
MRTAPVLLAIFVLSGVAGLVYEVVWARQLVLVFGNTTQAISAILTGFFAGMAIGSWVGGRIADRVRNAVAFYGGLEVVLAVVAIATSVTFRLVGDVYRGAFVSLESEPVALALVRFALALLALAPATVMMGATLPTLTRALARRSSGLSSAFSRLYAANTIGGIAGTVLAGFVLIELVGLSWTLAFGAACSLIAGVGALVVSRRPDLRPALEPPERSAAPTEPRARRTVSRPGLALSLAFASGLTSLGYQTLWNRLIGSGTGSSTYVFSLILAVFLVGLAIGALIFTRLRNRGTDVVALLAFSQVAVAGLAIVGMSLIAANTSSPLGLEFGFARLLTDFAFPTVLVVLPTTILLGITFPATSALVAEDERRTGTHAGGLLAANTLGAIVGTFVLPFFVIPAIGSPASLGGLALVNLGTGLALAARSAREGHRWLAPAGFGGLVVVLLVVAIATNRTFVDPSVTRIARAGGTVYASTEDEIASVQAGDFGGVKQIWVAGSSMTVITIDTKLMPILSLALRPAAKTILTVAFGMGTAYRNALIAGLDTEAVELVPSVPGMLGWFYPDAPAVLANPDGTITIADGRNHVELTPKRYDIIVTDPPPPIETAGVSVIASLEYYLAGRSRLTSGGVMMEWVPNDETIDEFRTQVRTFAAAFPHVLVAIGPGGHGCYLFGSEAPLAFDEAGLRAALSRPGVVDDLDSVGDAPVHGLEPWITAAGRLAWLNDSNVHAFAGDGPLITDDRPLPEYFLLRHLFGPPSPMVTPGELRRLVPGS